MPFGIDNITTLNLPDVTLEVDMTRLGIDRVSTGPNGDSVTLSNLSSVDTFGENHERGTVDGNLGGAEVYLPKATSVDLRGVSNADISLNPRPNLFHINDSPSTAPDTVKVNGAVNTKVSQSDGNSTLKVSSETIQNTTFNCGNGNDTADLSESSIPTSGMSIKDGEVTLGGGVKLTSYENVILPGGVKMEIPTEKPAPQTEVKPAIVADQATPVPAASAPAAPAAAPITPPSPAPDHVAALAQAVPLNGAGFKSDNAVTPTRLEVGGSQNSRDVGVVV